MKKITKILSLTLIFIFLLSSCNNADTKDINTAYNNVYKSFVKVSSGNLYGSGNILHIKKDTVEIISAYHIIADQDSILLTFYDGTTSNAQIVTYDKEKDTVILSTSSIEDSDYVEINISEKEPVSGDGIFVIDPDTKGAVAGIIGNTDVYIEDFDQNMIYCLISVTPGMSGSGCFDYEGNYLGMLLGGSDNEEAVCISFGNID